MSPMILLHSSLAAAGVQVLLVQNMWHKLCQRPKLLISRALPFFIGLCHRSSLFYVWTLSYSMDSSSCLSLRCSTVEESSIFFFNLQMWKPATRHISFTMQWTFQALVLVSRNQTNYMPWCAVYHAQNVYNVWLSGTWEWASLVSWSGLCLWLTSCHFLEIRWFGVLHLPMQTNLNLRDLWHLTPIFLYSNHTYIYHSEPYEQWRFITLHSNLI